MWESSSSLVQRVPVLLRPRSWGAASRSRASRWRQARLYPARISSLVGSMRCAGRFRSAVRARSFSGQFRIQLPDTGPDVVPDQAHAFHAFGAAFGGLVRIPELDPRAVAGFELGFVAQHDDDVGRIQHFGGDGFGVFAGDIDAEL